MSYNNNTVSFGGSCYGGAYVHPPVQRASLPVAQKPAASAGSWNERMRAWVERSFAACKSDSDRAYVEGALRQTIQRCNAYNTLETTNWDSEPLPLPTHHWPSSSHLPPSSGEGGRSEAPTPTRPSSAS